MSKTEWFIFAAIIAIMLLCSCSTKRAAVRNDTTDSTRITVRTERMFVRDTVYITLPLQTVKRTTPDSTSFLETEYAQSFARIAPDGTIYHSLKTKTQPFAVEIQRPVEKTDSIVERSSNAVKTEYVKRSLTRFQRIEIAGFWVLAFAALMAAGAWIFKKSKLVS
ncbi:MAG: hypothetical protein LUC22_04505 [Prevotella sp.]|nr:hypothetical protein [Prevotella sp.]